MLLSSTVAEADPPAETGSAGELPDVKRWLEGVQAKLKAAVAGNSSMGVLEKLIETELKVLGRPLLEQAVQQVADQQPLRCPRCTAELCGEVYRRGRTITGIFGEIHVVRDYGRCLHCHQRF
jgi:D-alanyl-D-alanine dipeptidase